MSDSARFVDVLPADLQAIVQTVYSDEKISKITKKIGRFSMIF